MILTTAAVGANYNKEVSQALPKISKYFNSIHILTCTPDQYPNLHTTLYARTVWSYIEKLIYAIKISIQYKKDVVFVDGDMLKFLECSTFLNRTYNLSTVYFDNYWSDKENRVYYKNYSQVTTEYFHTFKNFFIERNIEIPPTLPIPVENLVIFPYSDRLKILLGYMEKLQPILEYNTVANIKKDQLTNSESIQLGAGEGLALTVACYFSGLKMEKISQNSCFN